MPKPPSFAALLQASAQSRRYPFVERATLWEERLAMHLQDLEAVLRAPEPGDMLPLPARSELEIVQPGRDASGTTAARGGDLAFAPAAQIAQAVRSGALAPLEVADTILARIEQHRRLNAFTCVRPDQVRAEARALAERIARGEDPGPLAGVPVAVKDLMAVRGYPKTCGTKAIQPAESAQDADVVARLRGAGALIVGLANLHELAYGVTSANVHFGHVDNPAAPGHLPGGSSGGSGAAVAAGLAAIAVGTDTGGSIRIPAACCGVVGFKPSYDAVSRAGVWTLAWTLDHIGPLARSVADAALGFETMAGLPAGCIGDKRTDRPRLVRPAPFFFDELDDAVRTRIEAVLAQLAGVGAAIEERWVEGIEYAPATQFLTLCTEACQANWALLTQRPEGLAPDVRLRLEVGQFIAAVDYVKAQRLRRWLRDNLVAALKGADALVLPTLPVSIPRQGTTLLQIGGRTLAVPAALTRLTSPFNFSGLPAVSIPCGRDANGLPVGLQIVGQPGADASVLAAARWCEAALEGAHE
jgi:Asp-tRNA(Asn)/Glu-tRNA(Gln) amidotransferase A subunit family amidase